MSETLVFPHDNYVSIQIPHTFLNTDGNSYKWFDFYKHNIQQNERKMRSIVSQLINTNIIEKDRNIIDSGAFIGDNSLPWAKQITGLVYSIDPSINNEKLIKYLCEINDIKNLVYYRHVLSDSEKILTFNGDLDFNSFSYPGCCQTIIATSLDILYKETALREISFIHLDVEGEEYKTLFGSVELITHYNPIIIYEQHVLTDNIGDCIKLLCTYGYAQFIINEQTGVRNDCRNLLAIPANKLQMFQSTCSYLHELISINPENIETAVNCALANKPT